MEQPPDEYDEEYFSMLEEEHEMMREMDDYPFDIPDEVDIPAKRKLDLSATTTTSNKENNLPVLKRLNSPFDNAYNNSTSRSPFQTSAQQNLADSPFARTTLGNSVNLSTPPTLPLPRSNARADDDDQFDLPSSSTRNDPPVSVSTSTQALLARLRKSAASTTPSSSGSYRQPNALDNLSMHDTFSSSNFLNGRGSSNYRKLPSWSEVNTPSKNSQIYKLVSRHKPDAESVKVTTSDGNRFYLTLKSESASRAFRKQLHQRASSAHLLDRPYNELYNEITQDLQRKERRNLLKPEVTPVYSNAKTELWVDKYAPKRYTDLLSDEGINRECLLWIQQWNECVFNKKNKTFGLSSALQWEKDKINGPPGANKDILNRPFKKVLLICGQAGLGKTTLANIAARHCGYETHEVNASDDRSPEAFKKKIKAITGTLTSITDTENKPLCLILDEIDGAEHGAIEALIKIITAKTKKKKKLKILRPIICICNDLFAPCLKALKPHAHILTMRQASVGRLEGRLREICKAEKFRPDPQSLRKLVNLADYDLRSCLNTLQMLRRKGKTLSAKDLNESSVGKKDHSSNIFQVWEHIFKKRDNFEPGENRQKSLYTRKKEKEESEVNVWKHIESCNEYNKTLMGCFSNYLNINFRDSYLENVNQVLDWVAFSDKIDTHIYQTSDYGLMKYGSLPSLAFNYYCSVRLRPDIKYPHKIVEATRQKVDTMQSVKIAKERMLLYVSDTQFVLELCPMFLVILNPSIRPLSFELLRSREKSSFLRLVDILIKYNLFFIQIQKDGGYTSVLDPNLNQIASFGMARTTKDLADATKDLLTQQAGTQKLRPIGPTESGKAKEDKKLPKKPLIKQELTKDFFGRVIEIKERTEDEKIDDIKVETRERKYVTYIYHQGFTNAVKRSVKIRDLL